MIRTKDGVRSRGRWVVACVVVGGSFGGLGCTAVSGLRSVGLDHPKLLGLWGRSQPPSPGLGDDSYAQRMHAGDDRSGAVAKRSEEARKGSGEDGESDQDAK